MWKKYMSLCLALFLLGTAGASSAIEKTYTNDTGIAFILIPAGSFMMGYEEEDGSDSGTEGPRHKVTISKPFYIGKYEVTQAQWVAVMGSNPSKHQGDNNPVEQVSWFDVQEFISRLNAREGHHRYRLPSEAEWEYAARAGTSSKFSFGNDESKLSDYAWCGADLKTTHPVGQKRPNAWGLYDVHGNVWEWVQDWYGDYHSGRPEVDPAGPVTGTHKMFRGGSIRGNAVFCRSSYRDFILPTSRRNDNIGFRLALDLKGQ